MNPVATIVLGGLASFVVVLFFKYLSDGYLLTYFPQCTIRVFFGIFAAVFMSIAVAARNGVAPTLVSNFSTQAGMEMVAMVVTLGVGAVFGAFGGLIIGLVPGNVESI